MIVDGKTIQVKQIEYQEKLDMAAQRRLIKDATQANVTHKRPYHFGPSQVGQYVMHLGHNIFSALQAVHTIISFRGRENCESC